MGNDERKETNLLITSTYERKRVFENRGSLQEQLIALLGPLVNEFEQAVAHYAGGRQERLYLLNSTIHLALKLIGVQKGDMVFCSTLTFVATANPILYEQATPVFIDSEIDTWNMCLL
ncbi:DegT/DnrJ/EryC1/StrS family aminotransferase [Bacillus sp. SL00103]